MVCAFANPKLKLSLTKTEEAKIEGGDNHISFIGTHHPFKYLASKKMTAVLCNKPN